MIHCSVWTLPDMVEADSSRCKSQPSYLPWGCQRALSVQLREAQRVGHPGSTSSLCFLVVEKEGSILPVLLLDSSEANNLSGVFSEALHVFSPGFLLMYVSRAIMICALEAHSLPCKLYKHLIHFCVRKLIQTQIYPRKTIDKLDA